MPLSKAFGMRAEHGRQGPRHAGLLGHVQHADFAVHHSFVFGFVLRNAYSLELRPALFAVLASCGDCGLLPLGRS